MLADISSYSVALREIDQMRVDGKFVDADGNKAEGQYVSPLDLPRWGYSLTRSGLALPPPSLLRPHLPPHV